MNSINPEHIIQKRWLENRAYKNKDYKDVGKGVGFRVYRIGIFKCPNARLDPMIDPMMTP